MEDLLERLKRLENAVIDMKAGSIKVDAIMFESKIDYEMIIDKILPLLIGEIKHLEEKIKEQLYLELRGKSDES